MTIHHSIADLYKTLNLPFDPDRDFTILSVPGIHPHLPFRSPPLRANYFSFVLNHRGAGTYYLDHHEFPFGPQTIYFTNPGHIKAYELVSSEEAYIITLNERFLRENVQADIYGAFPFLLAEKAPPKQLGPADFQDFATLYQQMLLEFGRDSPYQDRILGNLFTVLLLKIKEKFWSAYNPIEEGNRDSEIVKTFKRLLEAEFKEVLENDRPEVKLQVQYFAEKMSLHPNYLTSVIKSKTGRTVQDWIASRTLSFAKTLLTTTSYSAKEIAYQLGFSEPTHFGRFFKRHTQESPTAFRKARRG